jgi:hypothetical protein
MLFLLANQLKKASNKLQGTDVELPGHCSTCFIRTRQHVLIPKFFAFLRSRAKIFKLLVRLISTYCFLVCVLTGKQKSHKRVFVSTQQHAKFGMVAFQAFKPIFPIPPTIERPSKIKEQQFLRHHRISLCGRRSPAFPVPFISPSIPPRPASFPALDVCAARQCA